MDSFVNLFLCSGSIFGGLIGTLSYFYNHGEVRQIFSIGLFDFDFASGLAWCNFSGGKCNWKGNSSYKKKKFMSFNLWMKIINMTGLSLM